VAVIAVGYALCAAICFGPSWLALQHQERNGSRATAGASTLLWRLAHRPRDGPRPGRRRRGYRGPACRGRLARLSTAVRAAIAGPASLSPLAGACASLTRARLRPGADHRGGVPLAVTPSRSLWLPLSQRRPGPPRFLCRCPGNRGRRDNRPRLLLAGATRGPLGPAGRVRVWSRPGILYGLVGGVLKEAVVQTATSQAALCRRCLAEPVALVVLGAWPA